MKREIIINEHAYLLFKGNGDGDLYESPYVIEKDTNEVVDRPEGLLKQYADDNGIILEQKGFDAEEAILAILTFINSTDASLTTISADHSEIEDEALVIEEVEEDKVVYTPAARQMRDTIESKKKTFLALYSKFKRINTIIMVIALVAMVPLFIWVMPIPEVGAWITIGVIIAIFIGMYVYSNHMKNKTNEAAQVYIDEYYQYTMAHVFENLEEVNNYEQLTKAKIETEIFQNARIMKNVSRSASRNVVTYDIDGREIAVADYVAYTVGEGRKKQSKAVFIGKFLKVENSINDEEKRTLIYLKPRVADQIAVGPNDIEGLHTIINDKHIAIYSSEDNIEKVLSKKVVHLLNEFKIGDDLIDVTISITAGHTYFAFSFSDDLMAVPLEGSVKIGPVLSFQDAISVANKIIAEVK